jgi:hypothetical protein
MRVGKVVIVTVINAFLARFFLAQYLGGTGGAAAAPPTWLLPAIAFAATLSNQLRGDTCGPS